MSWELLVYMFKANLIVLFCYLLFHLLMKGSVNHQSKRLYLILIPVLALLVPLVHLNSGQASNFIYTLPVIEISNQLVEVDSFSGGNYIAILFIWFLGLTISLIMSLYQFTKTLKEVKRKDSNRSYTFFKSTKISDKLPEEVRLKVAIHEQVHADQWHTLDLVFYELLKIVFWFNPAFRLGQYSLKEIHEYIADSETNKRTEDYSETLLAFAFGLTKLPLMSDFQSVNIKNRIKMIHKKNSRKNWAGLALTLSLAVFAVMAVSWTSFSVQQDQKVLKVADTMPVFSGCEAIGEEDAKKKCSHEKMMEFVVKNVNYPQRCLEEKIEGKVFVEFIVTTEGKVTKSKVIRGADKALDAEALRVIQSMPKWTPGHHDGNDVNVSLVLPIMFKL